MSNRPDQAHQGEGTAPEEAHFFYSLDRFNAFSDGVFAIAITLLVLDLPVPDLLVMCATYGWSYDDRKTRPWRPTTETQTA